jgi:hypothetical protein
MITLAQIRGAARASLGFPAQEPDQLIEALAEKWAAAEGAAEGALGETLHSVLERFEKPLPRTERASAGVAPSLAPARSRA